MLEDLRIVDIKEDVQPCLQEDICPSYPSKQPAKYVLEVNPFCTAKWNKGRRYVANLSPVKKKGVEPTISAWSKRVFLAAVSF